MSFGIFSKNGVISDEKEAVMPIANIEYAYGFGVYETIRAVRGRPLFLHDHLVRLQASAEILQLEHPFKTNDVEAWITALLERIQAEACNLKILLIGAREAKDATLFIIPLAPLFPDKRLYVKGATAITYSYERTLPHAKSLNMLGSYLAYREAKKAGAYDALLINRHDCITEGTRTNFFAMRGSTIFSPPKEDILEGVTMLHVLDAAKECGLPVEYRALPLADITSYDAVFLTSTSSKIMPLSKINELTFDIPEPLHLLMKTFEKMLESERA